MTFHDQPFSQRYHKLGDQAEAAFERVRQGRVHRSGLDRPPFFLGGVDPVILHTPDYLVPDDGGLYVECVGFGRDKTLKLRVTKLDALVTWTSIARVDIFAYHSTTDWWWQASLDDWRRAVLRHGERKAFESDGNEYFALHMDDFPCTGQPMNEAA